MYAMRERERVMDLIEGVTGGRFHPNFNRIGGVRPPPGEGPSSARSPRTCPRASSTGPPGDGGGAGGVRRPGRPGPGQRDRAAAHHRGRGPAGGAGHRVRGSGPNLRASGVAFDLRKVDDYLPYDRFDFDVVTSTTATLTTAAGCASRRSARRPASWSRPSTPCLPGRCRPRCPASSRCPRASATCGRRTPRARWATTSSRRGRRPYRVKIRSASFCNLSVLPWLLEGCLIPDIIAILGSLDFVLGDVDR